MFITNREYASPFRFNMKLIKQKLGSDCGIACVAMLTTKSYDEVYERFKTLFPDKVRDKSYYTDFHEIEKMLNEYNVHISRKHRFRKWESLPILSLLWTKYNKKDQSWHWVVFERNQDGVGLVYDPWKELKNNIRNDFNIINVKYYHEIVSNSKGRKKQSFLGRLFSR